MVDIKVKTNKEALRAKQQHIREASRRIVISQALGATAQLYEIYPVGPEEPHARDGTPHTRDTFKILVDGEVIAEKGSFWTTSAIGTKAVGGSFAVAFRAAGASFFLEFGTIFMEAQPLIRQMIKQARANIQNRLRSLNAE